MPNDLQDSVYAPDLYPNANNTGDVGRLGFQWQNGYFQNLFVNGAVLVPGIVVEVDPVFTGSPAFGITAGNITTWTNHPPLTTGTHGVTGTIVGTSDVQSLTNKQLTMNNGDPIKWKTSGGVPQDTITLLGSDILQITNPSGSVQISGGAINLNYNINEEIYLWGGTFGSGRELVLYGGHSTGLATLRDSPTINMAAAYWDGGASVGWPGTFIHDMITAGATPKSQLKFAINGVPLLQLENNNGTAKVYIGGNLDLSTHEIINGTLNGLVFKGTFTASGVVTFPAITMAGTLNMNDNFINNIKELNLTDPTTLTIAAGVVTKTQGFHLVDTEGGAASDDLDTINGGGIGDVLVLAAANDAREIRLTRNGNIRFQPEHMIDGFTFSSVLSLFGTFYTAGYYQSPAADANLTQVATTVSYGTANSPYGAFAFLVSAAAGTTNAGTVSIVVSGTSITIGGVRTAGSSETLVANITTMGANTYYQTTKRWIGAITYTLTPAGGATVYAADFNYGLAAYDNFDSRDFTIKDFEVMGRAGADDAGFNLQLIHHKFTGWTYSAAAFVPGTAAVCSLATDYSTESDLKSGERFKYERELNTTISGTTGEGFLVRVTTTIEKAVEFMNGAVYAEVIPNDHHLKNTGQSIQLIFNGTKWMKQ
jgi:hypothetical protein